MKKLFVAVALTLVGVGCGASDGTEGASETEQSALSSQFRVPFPRPFPTCPSGCVASGGFCEGDLCATGCENAPISCTATISEASIIGGYGYVEVSCTGIGNGVYTVSFTASPDTQATSNSFGAPPYDGPWTVWKNGSTDANGGFTLDDGQPLTFQPSSASTQGLDEDNGNFAGCHWNGEAYVGCAIAAQWVEVCATPGADPFSSQSGICGASSNSENFPPPACVYAQVTSVP